ETSSFCKYGEHQCNRFRTGDKIQVGDVTVEPIHVDHSIPAAYGFIIHTSTGPVVYTGDLRRHGPRKDLTEDFIDAAADCEPSALICEGTRMAEEDKRQNHTEPQVMAGAEKIVASTDNIVFTTRYSRDMDRFNSFYKVAKKNNRTFVVAPKTAYLLSKLQDDKHLSLPDPLKDSNIMVYYKRKRSGNFDDSDYYVWERKFMDKIVTHEYVTQNQKNLIMDLDFTQFAELLDIKPNPGSHFIHSMSEPFSEEDIEDRVMHNWIDYFKLKFHQIHASGHISKTQLIDMLGTIKSKQVFPVHTESPHLFRKYCNNTRVVEPEKEMKV
ncbi:MAG: MBL fold metallo-hydrolase, partial [Candidatus Bathyarchaeota archaeon]|nr:MBL fold metallo-hydrolase [Candidatus Bathyarchaeota archaeon]